MALLNFLGDGVILVEVLGSIQSPHLLLLFDVPINVVSVPLFVLLDVILMISLDFEPPGLPQPLGSLSVVDTTNSALDLCGGMSLSLFLFNFLTHGFRLDVQSPWCFETCFTESIVR